MRKLLALSLVGVAVLGSGYTYRDQRALNVAKAAWGQLPCSGHINIERVHITDLLDPDAAAIASVPCTIQITYRAINMMPWPMYCSLMVHEVGHLLGYQHSPDPRNVMYPGMLNYWRCRHSAEWYIAHRDGRGN